MEIRGKMTEFLSQEVLAYIGILSLIGFGIFLILLIIGVVSSYFFFRKREFIRGASSRLTSIFLRVLLSILDFLYLPSKKVISILGGNDAMVDIVNAEMRNMLLKKKFSEVPYSERIIILPQCLRDTECPASFSSVDGARCVGCGKCKIYEITKKANKLGYKGAYIAPGGGFVKRIIQRTKPRAVIGIGCPYEVNMGLLEVSNMGIPCQGIILLKSGCVKTDVDLLSVYSVMELK
ncbi:MAG TPA: DUF116 domain-containing protein [Candidatus Altiarchaeales archaeon]|nr:DUF116 domain-containing protein [Candidatus Altiarchaeales archaeon]HEX55353.1 DUF116 domain-containing protein [Candidatus Altiarchaeales archaeon]